MRLGTTEEDWCFADGDESERKRTPAMPRLRLIGATPTLWWNGWRQIGAVCEARHVDAVVEGLETDRSCLRGARRDEDDDDGTAARRDEDDGDGDFHGWAAAAAAAKMKTLALIPCESIF